MTYMCCLLTLKKGRIGGTEASRARPIQFAGRTAEGATCASEQPVTWASLVAPKLFLRTTAGCPS